MGFPRDSEVKESACNAGDTQEIGVWSLGQEDLLEKEMIMHSSILAWRIPWIENPMDRGARGVTKCWTQWGNWPHMGSNPIWPVHFCSRKGNFGHTERYPMWMHTQRDNHKDKGRGTSLLVQWLSLHAPNAGGPGSIPSQGTRSHMLQLRVHMLQLRLSTAKYIHLKKRYRKKAAINNPRRKIRNRPFL